MSNLIQVKIEELNALPATKIVENENVEAKFIQMYNGIWGTSIGTQIYQKEVFNFQKVLRENPAVAECSKMSLFGCFLDIAVNGLSLDPTGRPHCYLIPRNITSKCTNKKTDHCLRIEQPDGSIKQCSYYNACYFNRKGHWEYKEKRASVSITGYGELTMRMRAGQIKYADNPVVVYEGDTFRAELQSGRKVVTYSAAIPRTSTKVIGVFIRIVRTDGSEDYQWLLEGDIERLKHFSQKNNSYWDKKEDKMVIGKANDLYTSNNGQIDPGFLENKMIKHAFDAYPKVRIGKFTQMETMEEPEQEIDYGIEEIEDEEIRTGQPAVFGDADPVYQDPTVTVTTSEEDDYAGF